MSRTVAVAMSGGVDSSVAAALLKRQGRSVIGVMLRLWSEPGTDESNRCCTPDAMGQARRVAAQLHIPFYVVDAREAFRSSVVQTFLDGYARGETPNPCLVCNRQIRWTVLLDHALALGADELATGHYARTRRRADGTVELLRAVDTAKDQSYVLHVLGQAQLRRAVFPVGELTKDEVRSVAAEIGLVTARRKESQDLCFLAGGDYRQFLLRHGLNIQPGDIVTTTGLTVGRHDGLWNYTIGQRKGLGATGTQPSYVIAKDSDRNLLVIGSADERRGTFLSTGLSNWISGRPPNGPVRLNVKARYTAPAAQALVSPESDGTALVRFGAAQRDLTPGQAAVFYDGEVVLGGGLIREVDAAPGMNVRGGLIAVDVRS